jgi:hypothetical protein
VTDPVVVYLPGSGVWRVGRAPDPFAWSRPEPVDTRDSRSGNRFDSFHGDYGVCYFGTTAEACFAETLARFRPSTAVSELVREEWTANGWMQPGNVPADWRDSRILVRAVVPDVLPFVDVASAESLEAFRTTERIAQWLSSFGLADVDLRHWSAPTAASLGLSRSGSSRKPTRTDTSTAGSATYPGSAPSTSAGQSSRGSRSRN